jgi:hypothetical protein
MLIYSEENPMKFSRHAASRAQQRGISYKMLRLVIELGKPIPRPGDALEVRIDSKEKKKAIAFYQNEIHKSKRMIELIEKSSNVSLITDSDMDTIITVQHLT